MSKNYAIDDNSKTPTSILDLIRADDSYSTHKKFIILNFKKINKFSEIYQKKVKIPGFSLDNSDKYKIYENSPSGKDKIKTQNEKLGYLGGINFCKLLYSCNFYFLYLLLYY